MEFTRGSSRAMREIKGELTYNEDGTEVLNLNFSHPTVWEGMNPFLGGPCKNMKSTLNEENDFNLPSSVNTTIIGNWTASNCTNGGIMRLVKDSDENHEIITIILRTFLPNEDVGNTLLFGDLYIPHPTIENKTMLNTSNIGLGCYGTDDRKFSYASYASAR